MVKTLAALLAFLSISVNAPAAVQSHPSRRLSGPEVPRMSELLSRQGLRVHIDYISSFGGDGNTYDAYYDSNIIVRAWRQDLNPQTKIRVVLVNDCVWQISRHQFQSVFQLDLHPVQNRGQYYLAGRFSNDLIIQYSQHGGDVYSCSPSMALVVDGQWQTDPINGSSNFKPTF